MDDKNVKWNVNILHTESVLLKVFTLEDERFLGFCSEKLHFT